MSRLSAISQLLLPAALAVALAVPARATILTFDIDNFPAGNSASNASLLTTHAAYGDNVNSLAQINVGGFNYNYGMGAAFTPNVTTSYALGTNAIQQQYYTDGGDPPSPLWTNVDFLWGGGNPFTHYITFTPSGLWGVKVNSFDVFGYPTAFAHTFNWNLRANTTGGTILASGGPHAIVATHATPFSVTTGGVTHFGPLVLEIIHTAGNGSGWGMDNLNFDQVNPVPEPGTWVLFGLGAVGLAWRTRRRVPRSTATC